jgi:hypothetical protein
MLKTLIKTISKLFSFLGGVLVTLIVVTTVCVISHIHSSPVPEDVVKRLASPNQELAAFLISTNHSSERNINVAVLPYQFIHRKIKYTDYVNNEKTHLFWGAFDPDFKVNLHENIEWSEDSSLLILTVDYEPEPFKWAYDFNTRKEVTDPNLIESLWRERNQINTIN